MNKKMLFGALAVVLFASGCTVSYAPVLSDGEEVIATIKGESVDSSITTNDLYEAMKESTGRSTLTDLIDKIILTALYPDQDAYNEDATTEVESIKASYGDEFDAALISNGFADEQALIDMYVLGYLRDEYITDYAGEQVTDDEIQTYYDENYDIEIQASHILIIPETTDEMTDDEIITAEATAYALAEEIITKLNDGEDFATLANQYSDDSDGTDGGDLGQFGKGVMVTTFEDAAYALEIDEYSTTPVETEYGYHIILKTAEFDKAELETVKDDIIDTLAVTKLSTETSLQYQALFDLRADFDMDIIDTELLEQYETYVEEMEKLY